MRWLVVQLVLDVAFLLALVLFVRSWMRRHRSMRVTVPTPLFDERTDLGMTVRTAVGQTYRVVTVHSATEVEVEPLP